MEREMYIERYKSAGGAAALLMSRHGVRDTSPRSHCKSCFGINRRVNFFEVRESALTLRKLARQGTQVGKLVEQLQNM